MCSSTKVRTYELASDIRHKCLHHWCEGISTWDFAQGIEGLKMIMFFRDDFKCPKDRVFVKKVHLDFFFTARPTSLQVSIFLRLESYVRMFFSDIFVEIMFVVPLLSIAQDTWTWLGSWRFQDFILRTRNLLPFPKASKFATQN